MVLVDGVYSYILCMFSFITYSWCSDVLGGRCADVLINLPLLTSVTKLLTLSKLLSRSEISLFITIHEMAADFALDVDWKTTNSVVAQF